MELIEVKCDNCGKDIYVYESYVREHMYCTLGCLDSANSPESMTKH